MYSRLATVRNIVSRIPRNSSKYHYQFAFFSSKVDGGVPAYPGAKAKPTTTLTFDRPSDVRPMFRLTDETGKALKSSFKSAISDDKLLSIYKTMLTLNQMDTIFYDAQRQGRISFYMTNYGEEAAQLGSAAALNPGDQLFLQYREAGVCLWRGFTLEQCANQLFANIDDFGKGKQMPVHYGSQAYNIHTISSPLGTQIPHAVGAAYALKQRKNNSLCSVCYFGDGAASEGDFHAAFNFASTLECPVIFICRNNGIAISTNTSEQYKGDGIVGRAPGYGMVSARVDGNDLFAVYKAVEEARKIAISENRPVFLELMTYRLGHHSTSDDSTRYRPKSVIESWRSNNYPIRRVYNYLLKNKLWSEEEDKEFSAGARKDVLKALSVAEKKTEAKY